MSTYNKDIIIIIIIITTGQQALICKSWEQDTEVKSSPLVILYCVYTIICVYRLYTVPRLNYQVCAINHRTLLCTKVVKTFFFV